MYIVKVNGMALQHNINALTEAGFKTGLGNIAYKLTADRQTAQHSVPIRMPPISSSRSKHRHHAETHGQFLLLPGRFCAWANYFLQGDHIRVERLQNRRDAFDVCSSIQTAALVDLYVATRKQASFEYALPSRN